MNSNPRALNGTDRRPVGEVGPGPPRSPECSRNGSFRRPHGENREADMMHRSPPIARPTVLLAFGLVVTGCDRAISAAPRTTARDSAGITIVESSAPAWNDRTRWRLEPNPVLDI